MSAVDLVGGPFAVIESDPGVFTSLTRKLGILGLELVEMYDIEPWAIDHLKPHGLIFCFMWRKDSHTHRPKDQFTDPAADKVWFANQLSDDACATHAILNVVLNCPGLELGEDLRRFKEDTSNMSPVMRGLAVTNSPIIRPAHNSFARPADIRASLNNVTITTFDAQKVKERESKKKIETQKGRDAKKVVTAARSRPVAQSSEKGKGKDKQEIKKRRRKRKRKDDDDDDDHEPEDEDEEEEEEEKEKEEEEESYHFIGYVPAHGKVWELDGLKSGPLEVGELTQMASSPSSSEALHQGWMDVVRPALRMKMEKHGGSGGDDSNIRFSLLALVDDGYARASDDMEWCKRDRKVLERVLEDFADWKTRVDPSLFSVATDSFHVPSHLDARIYGNASLEVKLGKTYASDFGHRRMERDFQVMKKTQQGEEILTKDWEECVRESVRAKVALEDELVKGIRAHTDHIKRTHDYEPFIREYITRLHQEGLLNSLLDRDEDGRKRRKVAAKAGSKKVG